MEYTVEQQPHGILLFLSSNNSDSVYQNTSYEFTVDLPGRINLIGDWVASLTEFHGVIAKNQTFIDVYINILSESFVGDRKGSIARRVFRTAKGNQRVFYQAFTSDYYIPLKLNQFENIKVEIVGEKGESLAPVREDTHLVLSIKPAE